MRREVSWSADVTSVRLDLTMRKSARGRKGKEKSEYSPSKIWIRVKKSLAEERKSRDTNTKEKPIDRYKRLLEHPWPCIKFHRDILGVSCNGFRNRVRQNVLCILPTRFFCATKRRVIAGESTSQNRSLGPIPEAIHSLDHAHFFNSTINAQFVAISDPERAASSRHHGVHDWYGSCIYMRRLGRHIAVQT